MRLAFVVQRYGEDVNGGAELHCRLLAERLRKRPEVEHVGVFTSCARDYETWANSYREGIEYRAGVRIERIRTTFPRLGLIHGQLGKWIMHHGHPRAVERLWLWAQGPVMLELPSRLQQARSEYDAFIFFTYLHYPTVAGLPAIADKAVLFPTAHDEPAIYLDLYRPVFEQARAIAYNTPEERELVLSRFKVQSTPSTVVGCGVDLLEPGPSEDGPPFILYLGRVDRAKGIDALCEAFVAFKERHADVEFRGVRGNYRGRDLLLRVAGRTTATTLPDRSDVVREGFVAESRKFALLRGSELLALPSRYESLSLVLLEAWAAGKPVLVDGKCRVTANQVARSGGGFSYQSSGEFDARLSELLQDPELRTRLGAAGRAYVGENYSWSQVEERMLGLIKSSFGLAKRHTIVCLSSQPWHDKMWTNKQHIMSRLARDHRVLHVNFGPCGPIDLARRKLKREGSATLDPRRLLFEPHIEHDRGVTVLDFLSPHFNRLLGAGHRASVFSQFDLRLELLDRYLRDEGILDPVVWVYHPGYGPDVARLPHKLIVYDCVDEYSQFPEYRENPEWLRHRERELCRRADVVFTTSRTLFESKKEYNRDRTLLVSNVGDAEHFKRASDPETLVPDDIGRLPRPVIGFVGAVSDYKLNIDWVVELATRHPDWSVVLIGPEGVGDPSTDVARLRAERNVHLLGHRPYAVLPSYVKAFDVAVIPYRINGYTRHVFPIKFFELLASGKPVVISALPALEEYYGAVHVARNARDFVARCEHALANGETGRAERVSLAEQNSWPARVGRLISEVERRLRDAAQARPEAVRTAPPL